jgi:hydroxymethylglutaryl-CoA lyase
MQLPPAVDITEVGPRDGLQNEALELSVAQKVELIDRLVDCGIRRIEAGSFVHPNWIPQMRGTGEVLAALERRPGVTYVALVPNLRGAQDALAADADELATVVSASETHNRKNLNRTIEETMAEVEKVARLCGDTGKPWSGYVSTAFGCPYEGDVPGERVAELAERLAECGAAQLGLGDTTGMANPRLVDDVVAAVRRRVPQAEIRLHFHDTRGAGIANVLAALLAGETHFDASIGGLGGCPYAPGAGGNIATEDLVHTLHEMEVETGIDLPRLIEVAKYAEELAGRELPGKVKVAGRREDLVRTHGGG